MIDWLTFEAYLTHDGNISGGSILNISEEGEVIYEVNKLSQLEGSYSSSIQLKSIDTERIFISGNPVKFLQGHNVFGTNNLLFLVTEFMKVVCKKLGIIPTEDNIKSWEKGNFIIKIIDINVSFLLSSQNDVEQILRSIQLTAEATYQRKTLRGQTSYFGQHSRRIASKFYNKFIELLNPKKGHCLPDNLPFREEILEHSKNLLRFEVRIHAQELKKRNLHMGFMWVISELIDKIIEERIMKIKFTEKFRLTPKEILELKPALQSAYQLWSDGHDLRSIHAPRTYQRYKSQLLKLGINIAIPQPKKAQVIPIIKFLVIDNVQHAPDWAKGTKIYLESA